MVTDSVFSRATQYYTSIYQKYYSDRLVAIYLFGSVARGEAVVGVSDLDLVIVINDSFTPVDSEWELSRCEKDTKDTSLNFGVQTGPTRANNRTVFQEMLSGTRGPSIAACHLFYDSVLLLGEDLRNDFTPPTLNNDWAKLYLKAPCEWVRSAVEPVQDDKQGESSYTLPKEMSLRYRKLARLALAGGACLHMSQGHFQSFRGADLLPQLQADFPEWTDFLSEIELAYRSLPETNPEKFAMFSERSLAWMNMIKSRVG